MPLDLTHPVRTWRTRAAARYTTRVAMKKTAARLAAVLGAAGSRYFGSGASDFAAAIAYRVLFALAPLTVALASVFGLLLQNEELENDVVSKVASVLPVKTENVSEAIHNIPTAASAAGLVSLLVLVWAASGMMTAIRTSLERTMGVEDERGLVRGKLVDVSLVAATAVLVLASVGVGLVTQLVDSLVAELARAVGLEAVSPRRSCPGHCRCCCGLRRCCSSTASFRRSGLASQTRSPAPSSLPCCC